MSTGATAPACEASGRFSGVTLASGETLPARLVIAADCRRSILRAAAEPPLDDLGAPMDVLWYRVPMPADAPADVPLGTIDGRGMVVAIPRAGYWQCARIIEKGGFPAIRSEEHTSELQSLMRISYAVFCLKKKKKHTKHLIHTH